jgi:hypothetical protein
MPAPCNFIDRNTSLAICHPERRLAKSDAIRQTKSKDSYQVGTTLGDATNFRVAIGFFDNHETRYLPISSREAAASESRARKCRVRSAIKQ